MRVMAAEETDIFGNAWAQPRDDDDFMRAIDRAAQAVEQTDDLLRINGVSIVWDGGCYPGQLMMRHPYLGPNGEETRGWFMMDPRKIEKASRTQAVSMWTRDEARLLQWEDIGSLSPGCHADLIVVDRDPYLPISELRYRSERNEAWLKVKCVMKGKFPIIGFVKDPTGWQLFIWEREKVTTWSTWERLAPAGIARSQVKSESNSLP
jgi:hypothetical protein